MLNAAARLVYSHRTSEHTTPLLRELHWLRVPERIQFRLCVLAYHCVHGTAPAYLSDCLRPTSEIIAVSALLTPRHCRCRQLVRLPLATAPFRALQRVHGTVGHQRLGPAPHFCQSEGRPSLTFFVSHTADLRCPFKLSADVCVELCNSFGFKLCKVPRNCCGGSTVI